MSTQFSLGFLIRIKYCPTLPTFSKKLTFFSNFKRALFTR